MDRAPGKIAPGKMDKAPGKIDKASSKMDKAQGKMDRASGKMDKAQGKRGYLMMIMIFAETGCGCSSDWP